MMNILFLRKPDAEPNTVDSWDQKLQGGRAHVGDVEVVRDVRHWKGKAARLEVALCLLHAVPRLPSVGVCVCLPSRFCLAGHTVLKCVSWLQVAYQQEKLLRNLCRASVAIFFLGCLFWDRLPVSCFVPIGREIISRADPPRLSMSYVAKYSRGWRTPSAC